MVESVDSIKLASRLNKQWELDDRDEKPNVMLQVNTSHEEGNIKVLNFVNIWCVTGKSGCRSEESFDIAQHILNNCKNLNFSGVMTIGKFGHDYVTGPNPDFSVSH